MRRERETVLKRASLVEFAGKEEAWKKILEIPIAIEGGTKGKTILFPDKDPLGQNLFPYSANDLQCAADVSRDRARHEISGLEDQTGISITGKCGYNRISLTKIAFIRLAQHFGSETMLLLSPQKERGIILPDGKTLFFSSRGAIILEKILAAPDREILKGELRKATVGITEKLDGAIQALNYRLSKAGWEIKKAPAPGKDTKLILKPMEETVSTNSNIGDCPPEKPEQQVPIPQKSGFRLLSSSSLTEAEKREMRQIKNLIRSALTESLLRHLAERTKPQSKAIEFIELSIPLSMKESRKMMQQIICWSDQHIVKAVIVEYFEAGIKDLIIRGKNRNPPLTPEEIETYKHYGQLIKEGYTPEGIIEAISNFFPSETTEISSSAESQSPND